METTDTTSAPEILDGATADMLQNLVTGMGTGRDKRSHNQWSLSERNSPQAYDVQYESDWLSAAVVDTIPEDMLRERRTFLGLEPSEGKQLLKSEDDLGVYDQLSEALRWARLYGGAGLLMLLDGTGEVWEPLDVNRVRKGALKYIRVVDRWHLIPHRINLTDPLAENWGKPEFYRAYAGPDLVHRSRILFFHGVSLPYRLKLQKHFWGGSILDRVDDAVQNAISTQNGIASLVHEAKVDVFGIPGLFKMLGSKDGTARVLARLEVMQLAKSVHNMVIMDTNESWEQKDSAIVPGLADILNLFLTIASAASDIPVTRLIGTSATGLSATGEGDLRNYYDSVASKRAKSPDPQLAQLDEVLLRHVFGARPDDYSFEWPSLWQETETEKAANSYVRAQSAEIYVNQGAIEVSHVTADLKERGEYNISDEWLAEVEETAPPPPGEPTGSEPEPEAE